ncbi:MAG: TonB-dependent receptor domain-containing protein, partial [Terriglobales bacterium]
VEQRFWYDRGKLELNLFDNRFRDLIGFGVTDFITFEGSFFNVGQARARGSEVVLELAPAGWLRGRGSYTYLDSEVTQAGSVFDPVFEEGRPLLRRPKHSAALQVFAQWRRLSVASTTLFVGRRADSDFSALWFTSVDGYTRWDLSGRYRTTYGVTYFAAIENLLNRDYMEALGFPAVKRMVRAGARFEF